MDSVRRCENRKLAQKHQSLAATYFQRAINLEYIPVFLYRTDILCSLPPGALDRTVQLLLEAEEHSLGRKDDRVLDKVIETVDEEEPVDRNLRHPVLHFKSKAIMILHYCDVLIQRRSPRGYFWKGMIYSRGLRSLPGPSAAVAVWEEADKAGLADHSIYTSLTQAYRYVRYIPVPLILPRTPFLAIITAFHLVLL